MIVMKFGGTSLGNSDRIRNVAKIVKSYLNRKLVVIVSAVTKMTDALINLAKECAEGKQYNNFEDIFNVHSEIIKKLNNYLIFSTIFI